MVNQMREDTKRRRQKKVLELIIKYHTDTAEPVSSQIIAKNMALSSATIRNIMFDLEADGLIWQPHTSAGRIPTDRGYRSYVDSLMELKDFLEFDDTHADDAISRLRSSSIEDVLLKALEFCSSVTSQTCVALFPTLKIKERLIENLEERFRDMLTSLYDFEDRLYLDGTHYLIEQPEFKDIEKTRSVLRILENKKRLIEILEERLQDRNITVNIGSENKAAGLDVCTIITATYSVEDNITGTLGIIGPMRMEYEKVIPAVSSIAESMSRLLHKMV